ncbi:MAG: T9SS type A sorting domain-containing protein [bacterium]|nr:T9SS type A sorting domain-containing protein [Candidatus Kapabacteria bacterium]
MKILLRLPLFALMFAVSANAFAAGGGSDAKLVHPNPFTSGCTFTLTMPTDGRVRIMVYDLLGRQVSDLNEQNQRWDYPAGVHEVVWDGRDGSGDPVPAGTYICVLWSANGDMVNSVKVVKAMGLN